MNMKNVKHLAGISIGAMISVFLLFGDSGSPIASGNMYNDLHICAMHPKQTSEGPGTCPICGMKLSRVDNHKPGTAAPDIRNLFVSESDLMYVHEGPGKDPAAGKSLIPITQSSIYAPENQINTDQNRRSHEEEEITLWTCGMHPEVISEKPGICPICHMKLIPLKSSTTSSGFEIRIDPVTLQNIGVVTESVKRRDLSRDIRINGIITAAEDTQYKLNSRVSGWVEKLHVSRTGDPVCKDQPMLDIYSPELLAAQEEFLLALRSAENQQNSALLESARRRLELWDISPIQIDELQQTRRVRQTMTLVSPADGIILHKNVVEGSAVSPGMDLFFIADLREVWMKGQVYETDIPWIRGGDQVKITSPYDPDLRSSGQIDYIYPTVDPKNRSVEIRVILSNPELAFKPEMYVNATIVTSPAKNVLSVSKSAVLRSGERDIIFVFRGEGRFEPRQVHVGLETNQFYEIPFGLQEGEQVVVSGQFLLDSEAKLQEAIQRRLRMRSEAAITEPAKKDAQKSDHSGHIQ